MKLSMILARSDDNVIGVNGELPWYCPADLANFKKITSGKAIAMGSKTWNSLPFKPLPNRMNFIITSDSRNIDKPAGIYIYEASIEATIARAKQCGVEELVFIGGAQIYDAVKDIVDEVHLTNMNLVVGDVDGEKTVFDHEFVYYQYPDPENADWELIDRWTCYEEDTGKELFEYEHLRRK